MLWNRMILSKLVISSQLLNPISNREKKKSDQSSCSAPQRIHASRLSKPSDVFMLDISPVDDLSYELPLIVDNWLYFFYLIAGIARIILQGRY